MTKLNFHLIRSLIAIFPIFFLKILHPDSLDFQRISIFPCSADLSSNAGNINPHFGFLHYSLYLLVQLHTQGNYKLLPIPTVRSDLSLSLEYRRFHDKYKFQIPARVNNLSCWACLLCRRFPLPAVRKVSVQEDHLLDILR